MRAFLELLADGVSICELARLERQLAPGEIDALHAEGFLQPTGSRGFAEVSLPDVSRTCRALWGAGSGGLRTRSKMSHAPMSLGWLEVDDEPCELLLVAGDAYSLAAAARRSGPALVLVVSDRAMTPELRRRHGARARVRFVALAECLGEHGGRVCRVDLPVPMPSPLPARVLAGAAARTDRSSSRSAPGAPLFVGFRAFDELELVKLDNFTIWCRFGRRSRRLTAQDLGLAGERSRRPLAAFEMLMAFCENDGWLKTRRFGNSRATKTMLSRLRRALKTAFGTDAEPFHEFKRGMGWQARFRVTTGEDEYERALSPGARAVLARAGKLQRP